MLNDNRTFDPKAVALFLEAFDEIVADLDLRTDADREKAAKNRHEACPKPDATQRDKDPCRNRPLDAEGGGGAQAPVLKKHPASPIPQKAPRVAL
jgi:hypothetical protein